LLRLSEVDVPGNAMLLLLVSEYRPNLSYKASHAVIVVSGIATASSKILVFSQQYVRLQDEIRSLSPVE